MVCIEPLAMHQSRLPYLYFISVFPHATCFPSAQRLISCVTRLSSHLHAFLRPCCSTSLQTSTKFYPIFSGFRESR